MPDSAAELLERPAEETAAPESGPVLAEDPLLAESTGPAESTAQDGGDEVIAADLLVEEISIDGMCGVY
jgi:mycofactocin precursor